MKTTKLGFRGNARFFAVLHVVFWVAGFASWRCEANPTQYNLFFDPNSPPFFAADLIVDPADLALGVLPGSYIDVPGAGRFNIPKGEPVVIGQYGEPVIESGEIYSLDPVYFSPSGHLPEYDILTLSLNTANDDQRWFVNTPIGEPNVPPFLLGDGDWFSTIPVDSAPDGIGTIGLLFFSLTALGMAFRRKPLSV